MSPSHDFIILASLTVKLAADHPSVHAEIVSWLRQAAEQAGYELSTLRAANGTLYGYAIARQAEPGP